MTKGIRITVTDLETGENENQEIWNDSMLIVAGDRYLDSVRTYPNGTQIFTVKVARQSAV